MKITYYALFALCVAGTAISAFGQSVSPRTAMRARYLTQRSEIVSAYMAVDPLSLDRSALDSLNVNVSMDLDDILTVRMPVDAVDALSSVEGVRYLQLSSEARPMLDVARPEVGMDAVHTGEGIGTPYTGKGVVIGIVDSGFDYGHPSFRDSEGNLRIKRVWEQYTTPSDGIAAPEKYGYGAELLSAEQILGAGGDIFNNSHGTHVASIAAGSDMWECGRMLGMAPDADIVLVSMIKAGGGNVCISDGIAYIFDYADEVGKPCVVNLSLGNQSGPHDGTSFFDNIANRIQGPGRLIVGAAGNASVNNFHINKSVSANDAPMRTFIDFIGGASQKTVGGELEIWMQQDKDFEVSLITCKLSNGDEANRVLVYPSEEAEPQAVSLGRNVSGNMLVASETNPRNGKGHIVMTSEITSIRTGYAVVLEVKSSTGGTFDIWTDAINLGLDSRGIDGYTAPNGSTIAEIGGTAERILTVGAYTTRNSYTLLGETSERQLSETVGALASFSCYGPTADGRMKPQVTAPGCFISAAVSNNDHSGTLQYSAYYKNDERDNFYGFMQGTSMAAPFVTGIVATWLQAYPNMTPEDLFLVVKSTSRSDSFTGDLTFGDNRWGFGKVDAMAGLLASLKLSQEGGVSDVMTDPSSSPVQIVRNGSGSVSLVFVKDLAFARVDCFSATGVLLASDNLPAHAGQTIELNLAGEPGVKILRIASADGVYLTKLR